MRSHQEMCVSIATIYAIPFPIRIAHSPQHCPNVLLLSHCYTALKQFDSVKSCCISGIRNFEIQLVYMTGNVRDLWSLLRREKGAIGLFIRNPYCGDINVVLKYNNYFASCTDIPLQGNFQCVEVCRTQIED